MEKQNKSNSQQQWRPDPFHSNNNMKQPETPRDPMEFLSRSWSASVMEVSKALSLAQLPPSNNKLSNGSSNAAILEDFAGEIDESNVTFPGNPFSFASSETSQMVLDRIMSHSQEVSPRTSGRLSHSSGPLNGSLTDSPPVSPSEMDDFKYNRSSNNHPSTTTNTQIHSQLPMSRPKQPPSPEFAEKETRKSYLRERVLLVNLCCYV